MYHVLIPTDFSKNAENAIYYAMALYAGEQTVFFILNSYSPNAISSGDAMSSSGATQTLFNAVKASSEEGLKKLQAELTANRSNESHSFSTISKFDYFTNAVADVCKEKNIDMVVMGTGGNSGLKEALMGSNTANLIGKIGVPLLAVPDGATFSPIEEIAFATDYDTVYRQKNLDVLFGIANRFSSVIRVYHVSEKESLSDGQERSRQRMEKNFPPNTKFYMLPEKSLSNATRVFVHCHNIKLLCMVAKKHHFLHHLFGLSHTRDMCYHIDIPLLILQNEEK
ncbi:universal stress protein [Sinomicrobium sp.]